VKIAFATPVRAVSRGQVAVFYDGDRVLGGGKIIRSAAV
jgi:tRNA-uridine 2-sulfurtransferase